jgi:hypothetical protein
VKNTARNPNENASKKYGFDKNELIGLLADEGSSSSAK